MRVMLDTNILISALLFPSGKVERLFKELVLNHTIVISSYVLDEFWEVMYRKFPHKKNVVEKFLEDISFEFVHTPQKIHIDKLELRDYKDYPVIFSAIIEKVDVLLSGDKDLAGVKIGKTEIMTPAQFVEKYSSFYD